MPEGDAPEVPADVRERVERRYRGRTWRVHVCGEPDGEKCRDSFTDRIFHNCEVGRRYRMGESSTPPFQLFIELTPVEHKKE